MNDSSADSLALKVLADPYASDVSWLFACKILKNETETPKTDGPLQLSPEQCEGSSSVLAMEAHCEAFRKGATVEQISGGITIGLLNVAITIPMLDSLQLVPYAFTFYTPIAICAIWLAPSTFSKFFTSTVVSTAVLYGFFLFLKLAFGHHCCL